MADTATFPALPLSTPFERRLQSEWNLLRQMVRLNPARLSHPTATDATFHVTLTATPALPLDATSPVTEHRLRIAYPRFFPTVPLELYLARPMRHPNIHPVTGFVCLWDVHRLENNVEHALHKVAAILTGHLFNLAPRHVMQPEAVALTPAEPPSPLEAVHHTPQPAPTPRRRRLS